MIKRKQIVGAVLTVAMCLTFSGVVMAADSSREVIDDDRASWYGGITDKDIIYSKVWDHKVDGKRYKVTVWVKNDNGSKEEKRGTTSGVDEAGEVKITKDATYDHLFTTNKAGYKNLEIIG